MSLIFYAAYSRLNWLRFVSNLQEKTSRQEHVWYVVFIVLIYLIIYIFEIYAWLRLLTLQRQLATLKFAPI
jgi:hypothetical protein